MSLRARGISIESYDSSVYASSSSHVLRHGLVLKSVQLAWARQDAKGRESRSTAELRLSLADSSFDSATDPVSAFPR